ncbi:hypothetical protein FY122_09225 [Dictyoglomus thermophilum]|jgi:hypothetical protein|uniref:hypothetical protein n=1 Tax=Dictyoglomus thermophilum TaxID=14 RepID=UPI0011EB8C87|nr:hypothetical protein [Dictyoglomus thermophilum]TYT20923.1 hypothetical protein FY122_09225 [Dictyoglomus thermophilum]
MKNLQSLKDIFGPITIKRPIRFFIQMVILLICSVTILRIVVVFLTFILTQLGTWTDKLLKLLGLGS